MRSSRAAHAGTSGSLVPGAAILAHSPHVKHSTRSTASFPVKSPKIIAPSRGMGRSPNRVTSGQEPLTLIRFEESGLAEGCNQPIGKLWLYVLESHLCLNR